MRVAVITDIHANLPALEVSLAAIERARHDADAEARSVEAVGLPTESAGKRVAAA